MGTGSGGAGGGLVPRLGFCGTLCGSLWESSRCPPGTGRDVCPLPAPRCSAVRLGSATRPAEPVRVAEALGDAAAEGDGEAGGPTVAGAVEDDGDGEPVPAGDTAAPSSPLQAVAPRTSATRHTAPNGTRERAGRPPAAAGVRLADEGWGSEGRLICYDLWS
ncbi:hypothetical protein [Streptomyces marianii]|uniref:Uncharacterized protein n=1 Tax=Streptomyces marianii TaxID=1817406 RepID=A0A5R9EBD9_9ACTN|nr:hypothetical protein [Streptomyces marianii]TLQ47490.1 hypothetical protein FEF34_35160 [Streptomyces marianii]